ncbi:MAG: heme ABC transporter ATP-binding protein [Hyphomicrobiales bacterium]|nr:heme ABC transporter ATP-binding protein [Hyphomicrobiales bacterium]
MTHLLTASDLSLTIGGAPVLRQVDLNISKGEMVAIVGPNGAGKSTLLRLLSGELRPTRGAVTLCGRDLRGWPPEQLAQRRAMLSQHIAVSFPFTVSEIVQMGRGERALSATRRLIDAAIEEVGLSGFRDRELPTLSGGEQQRAHLARILVQLACGEAASGPALLLLDEPTSSLDLRHQIALVDICRTRARNGTAVIAVLHDLNLAVRLADRIVVMHDGKVVADGTPRETMTRDIIRQVFDIDAAIGTVTTTDMPYLLPQSMHPLSAP